MDNIKQELVETKFAIGAVVKHRFLDFRGVIFDVDPEFNNTEEWYESIPASIRPKKNQPFSPVKTMSPECDFSGLSTPKWKQSVAERRSAQTI